MKSAMNDLNEKAPVYDFGEFRIDLEQRILLRSGQLVSVKPRCFDTLALLVKSSGRVLQKDDLLKALWPDTFVEEGSLSQNIFVLRKVLGDDGNGHSFIQTIPRRGYKFVASVTRTDPSTNGNGHATQAQASYWNHHSPFRSLQAFEPEDFWLFFGRSEETDDLLRRLSKAPVLVVAGNSGCGKSSLIRAGLVAALRQDRFCHESLPVESWRIALFRPSGNPFDYLAEVLPGQLALGLSLSQQAEFIADCRNRFPFDQEALRNAISALVGTTPEYAEAGRTRVLLVADQFEELFTLTTSRETQDRYIDALLRASRPDSAIPVHLVLAFRADFYANCIEHEGLSRCLEANLYNVPRMTGEQLRATIERRLELAAARAEPGLIDSLLEDVGAEPGNLALLEHALGQLWDRCGGPGCTLTTRAYSEIGRLRGALGRHADEVYDNLGDDDIKRLAQRVFLQLVQLGEGVNAQDTRRRITRADLSSLGAPEDVDQIVAYLASSRLITTGVEGEETFVEVSHEALIREWPRLREWITQNREELRVERRLLEAAEEWAGLHRDAGALLHGARLAQGEEWLARSPGATAQVREFLRASVVASNEAERRELEAQQREVVRQKAVAARLRWFACGLALLLVVAAGAAWRTYRLQLVEESHALAAQAEEMRGRDQGQALDMAIRGWRRAKTDEARLAVTKAFPQLVATLHHDAGVESAVFSPDGQRILTASDDHTARLWSTDGHLLATLLGHTDKIVCAEFSPDGQRIVTSSLDHTARVWSTKDGGLLAILRGHSDRLEWAHFSPDGQRVITASHDHTARVWNSADGRLLATLQGHTDVVYEGAFSPDGKRIVTASWDHTARVWNGADYTLVSTLAGHSNGLTFVRFSPDSVRVVTGGLDHTARLWNVSDGRLLAILPHEGVVYCAAFSADSRRIVTGGGDHMARVWDSGNGGLLATLKGHAGPVWGVTLSRDGRLVLTDSADSTARVWNSVDGQLLVTLQVPSGAAYSPIDTTEEAPWSSAFSPDGRFVVVSLGDNAARVWNIGAAGGVVDMLESHTEAGVATFSSDSQRIITSGMDNTARIWSSADGRLLGTLQGHTDIICGASFSPDGQRIVTGSLDHTARIWNTGDWRLLAILRGHAASVFHASFSPDGQRIATASADRTARIWNVSNGRSIVVLHGHTGEVMRVSFSPDGQRILTASLDHTARLWSSPDGRLLVTLRGHAEALTDAAFSHDGRRVVTASSDHTARVWDSSDGHLLRVLQGHTGALVRARFSSDDLRIITASKDHTARVWASADGHLLATLQETADLRTAAFSPDGQRIITGSLNNNARLWNGTDYHLLAMLQGHSGYIFDAEFSADGQRIVTASQDQTARIWRVLTLDDIEKILAEK